MNVSRSEIFKHVFFTVLLLFSYAFMLAQPAVEWDRTYGGSNFDAFTTASRTADGGYLLCGSVGSDVSGDVTEPSRGSADFWIVKTDDLGKKQWSRRYGGTELDICHKVIQNTEGYLLVGMSLSNRGGEKSENARGGSDFWVIQIRPDGTKVWDKTYGGTANEEALSAIEVSDGYILAGHSWSNKGGEKSEDSRGLNDLWLVKIDRNGNKIWDKTYGGDGSDEYPTAFIKLKNGNFLVGCGSTSNARGDKTDPQRGIKDMWIIEFDAQGRKIRDKAYGGADVDELYGIQQVNDGSIFLAGSSQSGISGDKTTPNYGDYDYWLVKVDPYFNKIWDRSFGGSNRDLLTRIDQNKTGYLLLGGMSLSKADGNKDDSLRGANDFWLLYLDEQGDKIWDKCYGGDNNDVLKDMIRTSDGNYVLCGGSSSGISYDKSEASRGFDDYWIVKIRCFFELNLGNDTLMCRSRPVTLDATIPNCPNCLYQWSTGEKTAKITVFPNKSQLITVKVNAFDACEVNDKVNLVLIPSPEYALYTVKPPRCHNGSDGVIALDSAHGGTPPYFLVVNQDTFSRRIFVDNRKAGQYDVRLIDKSGCSLTTTVTVPNPDPFVLTLTDDLELPFGDSFRLTATSNHRIETFFWTNRSIRSLDTIVRPFDTETFGLTAIDSLGCIQKAAMQVVVKRDNLYFKPTAFSPNGDGQNDYFMLYGGKTVVSIRNFHVFNRWGQLVFSSPQIFPADETQGWNGNFAGKEAPPDVYVFVAEVLYIDGRKELIKGDVTLHR